MSGCAVNRAAERDLASALTRYQHDRATSTDQPVSALKQDVRTSRPQPKPDAAQAAPQSLRDALIIALDANPKIKAAEQIVRAQYARVPQVTALPDPVLQAKVLPEPVRTAEGDNYFVLGIQQKLPLPEKLDRAGRIALEEARMSVEDYQRTRLDVIAGVKRAYFKLYVIDKTVETDLDNGELLRGLIDVAGAQVASGRRSLEDVLRAQVELSTLESELIELRQQRQSAAADLNRLLDRMPSAPSVQPTDFALRHVDVTLERLFAIAVDRNPDLRQLEQKVKRDREAVALAKLQAWPDLTLGLEWIQVDPRGAPEPPPNPQTGVRPTVSQLSADGSDNWAISLGLNLPIWYDKIRAGIRERRARLSASQHEYDGARNRVFAEIYDALARVQAQRELATLFQDTIIPQAQQAYEVSRASYSGGRGDFLAVIDNWQKWLSFTIQYHRALGELERGIADLEQVLGLTLAEAGD
jgi:outer membrane protein TolC